MKVWVVMSNDFPDCVFDNEHAATIYVSGANWRDKQEAELPYNQRRRIYYRTYEFDVKS